MRTNKLKEAANIVWSNEELRNQVFELAIGGLQRLNAFIKKPNSEKADTENVFSNNNIEESLKYAEMFASILGQTAFSDNDFSEKEEDAAIDLINKCFFDKENTVTKTNLSNTGSKKKEIKAKIFDRLKNPHSIKKISNYTIENELEEDFYELACIIVTSDNTLNNEEKDFLNHFAERLKLSKYDIKPINNKYFNH